ncbi:MAG TPA: hypothetical protein VG817_10345 [Gemmatimonadales bacterium]|nr:hypothetical protein [Gemmatimonadales bacterium]
MHIIPVLAFLFTSLATMETSLESQWISTCEGAGCHGRYVECLSYVAGGKRFYCYRNFDS